VPNIIIIAGPNGAGKTTFGDEYLSTEEREFAFVNADEIARDLDADGFRARSDVLAARTMLKRVDTLVKANADLVVETTLATLAYAQKIPGWRSRGYVVSLVYLRLGSVEESIMRVRRRVAAGGHSIPENTIHRRFWKEPQVF
jgi:predicted ABC-type ATPase